VETLPGEVSADEFFLIALHWLILKSKNEGGGHNSHGKQVAQAALFATKLNNQHFNNINDNK